MEAFEGKKHVLAALLSKIEANLIKYHFPKENIAKQVIDFFQLDQPENYFFDEIFFQNLANLINLREECICQCGDEIPHDCEIKLGKIIDMVALENAPIHTKGMMRDFMNRFIIILE